MKDVMGGILWTRRPQHLAGLPRPPSWLPRG